MLQVLNTRKGGPCLMVLMIYRQKLFKQEITQKLLTYSCDKCYKAKEKEKERRKGGRKEKEKGRRGEGKGRKEKKRKVFENIRS